MVSLCDTVPMPERRQHTVYPLSRWSMAVAALLLLVILLAAVGHGPVAVCCLVLAPIFLFSLVELRPDDAGDELERGYIFEDGSPSLSQRPLPPSPEAC